MDVGTIVLLVRREDGMPPLGAIGEIVRGLDCYGDYLVSFGNYPCKAGGTFGEYEPEWDVPPHMLMPIGEQSRNQHRQTIEEYP